MMQRRPKREVNLMVERDVTAPHETTRELAVARTEDSHDENRANRKGGQEGRQQTSVVENSIAELAHDASCVRVRHLAD